MRPAPALRRFVRATSGFTLVEMLITITVIGVLITIFIPRLRTSGPQAAYEAARQIGYDLEAVRERALSTSSRTVIVFDPSTGSYAGYLDTNRDGVINQTEAEAIALQLFKYRALGAGVMFGVGSATPMNDFPGTTPVTLPGTTATFDTRGLMSPIGTRGAIYVQSRTDPSAVAAVTITGSSYVRIWRWQGGRWR